MQTNIADKSVKIQNEYAIPSIRYAVQERHQEIFWHQSKSSYEVIER